MFRTIVFAYDGNIESQEALVEGVELAGRFKSACFLLAVVPPLPAMALAAGGLPGELMEAEDARINTVLTEGLERLRHSALSATGILRRNMFPFDAIVDVA